MRSKLPWILVIIFASLWLFLPLHGRNGADGIPTKETGYPPGYQQKAQ